MPESVRYGILIANTGTPDEPKAQAIARFLRQMLMDRAIVNCPHIIWKPILEHFILPKRPQRTASRYQQIWTAQGSPFMLDSIKQQRALRDALSEEGMDVPVALGMRYGNPSFAQALEQLKQQGCSHVAFLPLYPQQAKTTTGTCISEFKRIIQADKDLFEGPIIEGYCQDEAYLDALAQSIEREWSYQPGSRLLFAFHSVPLSDIKAGDPYYQQTLDTAAAVAKRLNIAADDWTCAYHSRFDSRRWLKPSAEEVLQQWAQEGVANLAVVAPGFSADCIETLVDIDVEQRRYYLRCCEDKTDVGSAAFSYVPCLADDPAFISALRRIVLQQLR